MIKFIASDLDGTLLDENAILPKEIFPIIKKLSKKGIIFSPASGRQHASLTNLFEPVKDDLLFICENGALVRQGPNTLLINPLPTDNIHNILEAVREEPDLYPILCGADNAYIEDSVEPFYTHATIPYKNCIYVDNLDTIIKKEPLCKISIYDLQGAGNHAMNYLPPFLDGLNLILSGNHWCDIALKDSEKGITIEKLQKLLKISPDECMAFGDQMNDISMLNACTHSIAVNNAYEPVKQIAKYIVPSNKEKGVIVALNKLLEKLN